MLRRVVRGINPNQIPLDMLQLRHWVGWRAERQLDKELMVRPGELIDLGPPDWSAVQRPTRWTKVPRSPHGGSASATDPTTWGTFEQAIERLDDWLYGRWLSGLGFVFVRDLMIVGIDLDRCFAEDSELKPWAARLLDTLPASAFIELSPSGNGLHIYVRAEKPSTACAIELPDGDGKIEVYDDARFFCVTANRPIADRDSEPQIVEADLAEFWRVAGLPSQQEIEAVDRANIAVAVDAPDDWKHPLKPVGDPNRIELLLDKPQARQLWRGDWAGLYDSQSEADLALCSFLMLRFGRRPAVIHQLFESSGLLRPKWYSKRGTSTYGRDCCLKVCGIGR